MTAAVFHPILDQVLLGLRNAVRAQCSRPAEALFIALAWTTAANPWTGNTDEEEPWRRSLKLDDGDDDLPQRGPSKKELRRRLEEQASAKAHAEELDRILQKISRDGMGSLTRAERKFLEADTTRRRVQ